MGSSSSTGSKVSTGGEATAWLAGLSAAATMEPSSSRGPLEIDWGRLETRDVIFVALKVFNKVFVALKHQKSREQMGKTNCMDPTWQFQFDAHHTP